MGFLDRPIITKLANNYVDIFSILAEKKFQETRATVYCILRLNWRTLLMRLIP